MKEGGSKEKEDEEEEEKKKEKEEEEAGGVQKGGFSCVGVESVGELTTSPFPLVPTTLY